MDLTIALKDLRPAVTAAKKLTGRAYVPAMNGLRITATGETCHVESTDLELALTVRVPAIVRESGTVLVDGKSLATLLKGKGSVILTSRDGFLRVQNGIATDLPLLDQSEYPADVAAGTVWAETANRVDLATVGEVAAAASTDQARPILAAVYFDGVHRSIVATDSYRLHLADIAGEPFPTALVPARAFSFLPKSGAAYMTVGNYVPTAGYGAGQYVRLETDAVTVVARSVDVGEFPNYRQLIPADPPHAVTVDREAFAAVVCAVGATVAKSTRPVRLRIDGSELEVFAHDDNGRESSSGRVPAKGDDLDMFPAVAFNPGFLVDAVSTLRGETVTLRLTDGLKPGVPLRAPGRRRFRRPAGYASPGQLGPFSAVTAGLQRVSTYRRVGGFSEEPEESEAEGYGAAAGEVARILRTLADVLDRTTPESGTGRLIDLYGNDVGTWGLS